MTRKITVKLTANFERNLEAIEAFLAEADAPCAYDRLLDELADALIPNLEHFPAMGRPFLERPVCSVEVANALAQLQSKLQGVNCANICLQIILCCMHSSARSFICCLSNITVNSHSILTRSGRKIDGFALA